MRRPVGRADRLATDPSHGVISPTPPGPEGSKGTRALAGVRGVPSRPGEDHIMAGDEPGNAPQNPPASHTPPPAAPPPRLRWRFTAGTARRRSLRSAARNTSQSRYDRRYATAGCTTPTSLAGPGAVERHRAPGSSPVP